MSQRIKLLVQKRTSFKNQLINLTRLIDEDIEKSVLKLRSARLTDLYHAYENLNDELLVLDPNGNHSVEFDLIQEQYYELASKVENMLNPSVASAVETNALDESVRSETIVSNIQQRRIKLPQATLPTFDGRFENWISFKNSFQNIIDSQSGLSEVDKLHYLKSSLIGDASGKIKIFTIDGVNYAKAWDVLMRSYEVKRVLVSRHLSLLINLPTVDRETTGGLTRLADDAQQHVASLKSLGVELCPEMVVHIVESKLPKSASERWETTLEREEMPIPDQLYEYIYKSAVCASKRERSKEVESSRTMNELPIKKRRVPFSNRALLLNTQPNCVVCKNKRHPLHLCDKFKCMPVHKRIETVKLAKLCYNCMRSHFGVPCSYVGCHTCKKRHNTLLHMNPQESTFAIARESNDFAAIISRVTPQLLTTAIIQVQGQDLSFLRFRALLDTRATANFISEDAVKRLRLQITKQSIPIGAIGDLSTFSQGIVQISIRATHGKLYKELTCLIVPIIANMIPSESFARDSIVIPSNIRLADPEFHVPRAVDILIGSGATLSLFSVGQINLTKNGCDLYLQKTQLGWVIAGGADGTNKSKAVCQFSELESQIVKFWEVEEIPTNPSSTEEKDQCETYFMKTTSRANDGRYIVRLPFRYGERRFGESRKSALRRLMALERRLTSDNALKIEYSKVLEEYIKLGHMTLLETANDEGYYMPHHAVIKESSNTTKVRVVFDASAKTSAGVSLNDMLMIGPTIQNKLITHLLRLRTYRYILIADIEKMYRQVWIHFDDRRYQRILWRWKGRIRVFQLNTVTFGVAASAFLAIRVIHQLAKDERLKFPRASKILLKCMYVDDLLAGANSIDEAREIMNELIELLKLGGFSLRQWASNDQAIIENLESNIIHKNFTANADRSLKTLGIAWRACDDKFYYSARSIDNVEKWTKRAILSEIAKIFDPLGILGPIILYAKKMMQNVWQCNLHWDESVPQSIHTDWIIFAKQLEVLDKISFDRRVLIDDYVEMQIHGFCDASINGYGACIYIRSLGKDGSVTVRLLCSKSRVAPLKSITIPKFELSGALLLSRLIQETTNAIALKPSKVILWCDSTIVLHWLRTSPHLLKMFIANRVTEIQKLTEINSWRHVRSADNPADALSRGQLPRELLSNNIWFTGPHWLRLKEAQWPFSIIPEIEIPEMKKNTCFLISSNNIDFIKRFSSYTKLNRVIAYCLRFRYGTRLFGTLSVDELIEAERRILKMVQNEKFADEIKALNSEGRMKLGRIANLSPFFDNHGLIRVGGRLQHSTISYDRKHPILLPAKNHITDLIISQTHEKCFHAGIKSTLYNVRQRFWVLDGNNQVRKIVRNCVRCFKFSAKAKEYKMGNLPMSRVCETPPFTHSGIDYAGPFYVKEKKYRNKGRVKVYACIFVCMATKAVHIELVSELTTAGFIAALRRFSARRGIPKHVYTDNGTNFVGANNELRELYVLFNTNEHHRAVDKFASEQRLIWHFIPPAAPHFGGLWEAAVKTFKHHLRRVVGEILFTFEELNTLIIEIESILNSRPITAISSDPNDLLALTPAHFLIGKPLTAFPEEDLSLVAVNRLSTWQHISRVRQDFWKRWRIEYLNELQIRTKWKKDGTKIKIGIIVIIRDDNSPCSQWLLGRVTEIYPGDDGVVRAALVKTAHGVIKRASNRLCPLPNMEEVDSK